MMPANHSHDSSSYNGGNNGDNAHDDGQSPAPEGRGIVSDMLMRLKGTENPVVEGQTGRVLMLEPWGAVLETEATVSGRYRATWKEMEPVLAAQELPGPDVLAMVRAQERRERDARLSSLLRERGSIQVIKDGNGIPKQVVRLVPDGKTKVPDRQKDPTSFTGEFCTNCQGARMQRTGACSVCLDCGTSAGCG
jgi:hypothetical protein